jgi:hypothetical protein
MMKEYDGITITDELRKDVTIHLPIINEIKNVALKDKVIDAWAFSLASNGFTSMSQLPIKSDVGGVSVSDPQHTIGIVELTLCAVKVLKETAGIPVEIDRDLLIAMSVCHDMGKTVEYNKENQSRWTQDPKSFGNPSSRHPFFGGYSAMVVGLPDEVVSACFNHSYTYNLDPLGEPLYDLLGGRMSFAAAVIAIMDMFYWKGVACAVP